MPAPALVRALLRGLPEDASWTAPMLARRAGWRLTWSAPAVAHYLEAAQRAGVGPDTELTALPPSALASAGLDELAHALRRQLDHGPGMAHLARPDTAAPLAAWQLRLLALGLARALGPTIDRYGALYDVVSRGGSYRDRQIPISQTSAETGFHTDSSAADINPELVGLLCVRPARTGGDSQIASAAMVLKRLSDAAPQVVPVLCQGWLRDLVTPGAPDDLAHLLANRIPIFASDPSDGLLTFRYMRFWIERGHARAGIELPCEARDAMDRLDEVLAAPDIALTLRLEPGEILIVHNRRIAHSRTAYTDEPGHPRTLVRWWVGRDAGASAPAGGAR